MFYRERRDAVSDLALEEFLNATSGWREPGSRKARKDQQVSAKARLAVRNRLRKAVTKKVAASFEVDSFLSSILLALAIRMAIKLIEKWMDEL